MRAASFQDHNTTMNTTDYTATSRTTTAGSRLAQAEEYDRQHGWTPFTREEKREMMEAIAEITNL